MHWKKLQSKALLYTLERGEIADIFSIFFVPKMLGLKSFQVCKYSSSPKFWVLKILGYETFMGPKTFQFETLGAKNWDQQKHVVQDLWNMAPKLYA